MVKFRGLSSTALSPYGQKHPRSSLQYYLTFDQLLTTFHQRALLNQVHLKRRSPSETCHVGNVRIQCSGDIQISLKAHHAEQ